MARGEGPPGGGRWPEGTCFFNREKEDPEEARSCAYPAPMTWGLAATVLDFFGKSKAVVKFEGMSRVPGYRDRKELESLARAHKVPWTEYMLKLFGIVEDPWIESARKKQREAADAARNEARSPRGRRR